MKRLRKIWNDPVWSKVIANSIIAVGGYFIIKLSTAPVASGTSQKPTSKYVPTNSNEYIFSVVSVFLHTTLGRITVCAIVLILITWFILNIVSAFKGWSLKNKYNSYIEDQFWDAKFKWKWSKDKKGYYISYSDIEKICPNCKHDLSFYNSDFYFSLRCDNCGFESNAFYTSSNDPEAFVLNLFGARFDSQFKSKVNAGLRYRSMPTY